MATRIFVTGATGFVGSAVVQELLGAGHRVLGLARSDVGAAALAASGAEVHRGSLEDLGRLRGGAAVADGVIHTAFVHDFTDYASHCETDRRAIGALGEALAGSDRPLVITSGTGIVAPGRLVTEDDEPALGSASLPRVASEEAAAYASALGARVSIVRLPLVHGAGDHGFLPLLIDIGREKAASAYLGDGLARTAAVHRLDAARLYRLVLERGSPRGRYHAVAEEGVPFRAIADVIGRRLDVPVVGKAPEDAAAHFGWLGRFVASDRPASSGQTRTLLGWQPEQASLLLDLDQPDYFDLSSRFAL